MPKKTEIAPEATGVSPAVPYTVSVSYDVPYVEYFDVMATSVEDACSQALEMSGNGEGGRGGRYADDCGPSYVDVVALGEVSCPFSATNLDFPVHFESPEALLAHKSAALVGSLIEGCAVDLAKTAAIEVAYGEFIKALRDAGYHKKADMLPKETLERGPW